MKKSVFLFFFALVSFAAYSAPPQCPSDFDNSGTLPSLGFNLSAYSPTYWDRCEDNIAVLAKQGFGHITFSIAYGGTGDQASNFTLDTRPAPAPEKVARCIQIAWAHGMSAILKPHIDGGWRGGYDFDPEQSAYFETILLREIEAIKLASQAIGDSNFKIGLTLGTELSKSEKLYSKSWVTVVNKVISKLELLNLRNQVHLSYDFMFDFDRTAGTSNFDLGRFISRLDSVSLSQYVPQDTYGRSEVGVQRALGEHVQVIEKYLGKILPARSSVPPVNFGEYAIGSSGLARPWEYDGTDRLDSDTNLGYRGMLRYLRSRVGAGRPSGSMEFATLWTIGAVFDVMGNWYDSKRSPVADDIEAYNQARCHR